MTYSPERYQRTKEKTLRRNDKWRRINIDKVREINRKWREINRDKDNADHRRWVKSNPKKRAVIIKKYNDAHIEEKAEYHQEYRLTPPYIYHQIKQNAGKRNCGVELTKEEFIDWYGRQKQECYYCGVTISRMTELFRHPAYNQKNDRLTIDRLDNNRTYALDNMVLACQRCNAIKSNFFTAEEMKIIGERFIKPKWQNQ